MESREVKYAVVTLAFVVDPEIPEPLEPCFLTIWPGKQAEIETHGRKGHGASRITYRWRRVRDPSNAKDLAGEALAVVLDAADEQYKPGDFESMAAWQLARVHECEHGHYPPECSKCVLLYSKPEDSDNGD